MPLINGRILLLDAQARGYGVGAFNIENMEMMQAAIATAEAEQAPLILQTTPSTVRYGGTAVFGAMARALAGAAKVPIALHLNHGDSAQLCTQAAADGYTSLMIDGSKLPLAENIALTRQVVDMAAGRPNRPCVEAELGRVGGKEDQTETAEGEERYTDPEAAVRFVAESGADSLAVAIGTAHGFYRGTPKLDFDRLAQLRQALSVPLVLHGTSGVPDGDVRRAVELGICKVNYATELRAAYTQAVRAALEQDGTIYDPKRFGQAGRASVTELVRRRIALCGASGMAPDLRGA